MRPRAARRRILSGGIILYKGVKRALDVTFSLIGTAVSSPILLAVAAAVKLDSKGPVIFKQERLGKDGKF